MQKHQRVQTPRPQRQRKRMPMKKVVKKIVDKWSASYMEGAARGHVPSLLKMTQLQHTGSGFGRIRYNPVQGRRWLEHEVTTNPNVDKRVVNQLRRLVVRDEQTRDKLEQLQRFQLVQGDHNGHIVDPSEELGLFNPRGHSPMWYWRRSLGNDNRAYQRRTEELLEAEGITKDHPDYKSLLRTRTIEYTTPGQDDNLRIELGYSAIPSGWPQLTSRFEQNYAIKAVLDGKMQRRITDPIPRPIHEYVLVHGTPLPQYVDPATQSIQLANMMRDKLKTNLETALTGKTYVPESATLADTPVVPSPAGALRRYTDIVDDERFNIHNITLGPVSVNIDIDQIMGRYVHSRAYWPIPDTNVPRAVARFRKAYAQALDQEEFQRIQPLRFDDDQEWHGRVETNHVNPHFDELNERSDYDWSLISPNQMWNGDRWTEDDELALDNFRGINIGREIAREPATPVESRFPYNGIPRRNFFLSDPMNHAKPWTIINVSGSDHGEEELPGAPMRQIYTQHIEEVLDDSQDGSDLLEQPLPDTFHAPSRNDVSLGALAKRLGDPVIAGANKDYGRLPTIRLRQEQRELEAAYDPKNYLTRAQYTAMAEHSVIKYDDRDASWFIDNDALDVRKLPKTTNAQEKKKQIDTLVNRWLEVYTMQNEATSHRGHAEHDPEHTSDDEKFKRKLRHPYSKGRDTHPDFALQASADKVRYGQSRTNDLLDNIHKAETELKLQATKLNDIGPDGHFNLDTTPLLNSDIDVDAELNQPIDAQNLVSPNIPRLKRLTTAEARQRARERLAKLQKENPDQYQSASLQDMIDLEELPINDDEIDPQQVLQYDEHGRTWIQPIDVEMAMADDGHFGGFDPLGNDPSMYIPLDTKTATGRRIAFHPGDGSPMLHDSESGSRVAANRARYQRQFNEIFAGIEIDPDAMAQILGIDNEDRAALKVASMDLVRKKLEEKLTDMINSYQDGSLYTPADLSSEDEDVYQVQQPHIRPTITTFGNYHPFWNRVIPNPAVFMPQSATRQRKQVINNYEMGMWNEYGEGKMSYADAHYSIKAQQEKSFFDPKRAKEYYSDESSDIDYNRPYSREEIKHHLNSGRFVVARRSDVDAVNAAKLMVHDPVVPYTKDRKM